MIRRGPREGAEDQKRVFHTTPGVSEKLAGELRKSAGNRKSSRRRKRDAGEIVKRKALKDRPM